MSITMRQMLEAGCHFGHQTRFWNPQMSSYIYGERNHIHIINLEKTIVMFRKTLAFVQNLAKNHGSVLFVGTKRAASEIIAEECQRCQMPYVDHRWLGGMLTNFKTVKKSIKRLQEMEKEAQEGLYATLAKKEILMHQRKIDKLARSLRGISSMYSLPDAVFVIDVDYQRIAVAEANKLGIPVIGIVDTNSSPSGIDYVIPGNDDSQRAIRLYARGVADAILLGRSQSVQELKKMVASDEEHDSETADLPTQEQGEADSLADQ